MSERAIASQVGRTARGLGRAIPPQFTAAAAGLVIWELGGRWLGFAFLPPFTRAARAVWELARGGQIVGNLAASLASLAAGFGLAAALGVVVGALMGRYRAVEYLLDMYLNAFLATPTLIFVPVLFALFGVSRLSQVAVVFIYAFFVIVANTMTGVRLADATCLEMARSFGASERQLFWKIVLPGALPMIMAGLRIGIGRAVKGMINGEMLIALVGLGALIKTYGGRFEMDKVLGILMVVIAVALVCTGLMQALDRRLTRWTG